jgi:hypothetical protein
VPERRYKGYRIYAYITLSRLFAELDLDLGQPDLMACVEPRLAGLVSRVSKEQVLQAIRSNSHMTEKVLEYLQGEGHVTVGRDEHGYDIRITLKGVEHLREYHRLYRELYARELAEHYRFVRSPEWMRPTR